MKGLNKEIDDIDVDAIGDKLLSVVFGDIGGLALFLVALAFFTLYWRIGIFSTDSYTVANTIIAVSEGHLWIENIVYGPPSGKTPGMHIYDGKLFGRNYGVVVLSLPIFFILQLTFLLADLTIALIGVWCLGLLGLSLLLGDQFYRSDIVYIVGGVWTVTLFTINVAVARSFDPFWLPLLSLQMAAAIASGLIAVMLYRVVHRLYGRRIGFVAGIVTITASPIGFWATIPKRHALTTLFAIITLYCFFRSRQAVSVRQETKFRSLAYGAIGLSAWMHAPEAFILLIALLAVDLPTARGNRLLELSKITGVFVLSLIPFFVTNYLISGNPIQPPSLLPGLTPAMEGLLQGGPETASTGGVTPEPTASDVNPTTSTPTEEFVTGSKSPTGTEPVSVTEDVPTPTEQVSTGENGSNVGVFNRITGYLGDILVPFDLLITFLGHSLDDWADFDLLYHTFIRSGYIDSLPVGRDRAINLSVLESMPLLGVVLGGAITKLTRLGKLERITLKGIAPHRLTDIFVLIYVILIITLYLDRLPEPHMHTVRYFHPIYAMGVYGLFRFSEVRSVFKTQWRRTFGVFGLTVLLGSVVYIVLLWLFDATISEAVQLYGIVAVVLALVGTFWMLIFGNLDVSDQYGAIVLGSVAGAFTVYILISGLGFFAFTGNFALPISHEIAEALRFINPLRSLW